MNSQQKTAQQGLPDKSTSQYQLRLNKPNYWNTPSPSNEQKLLKHWRETGLLGSLNNVRAEKKEYWLLDGPPYANGDAHLGHLLNKTLKDVSARFASLQGFNVKWRAGWDCHGLPLELAVEKKQGSGAKEDAKAFMHRCRAEAKHWQSVQSASMQRAGLLAEFDEPWLSLDPERESMALNLMLDLWKSGLLVERSSPVHWCPACRSALAASELEKEEKTRVEALFVSELSGESLHKLNATLANKQGAKLEHAYVLSWTSTPWTLWANAGFAFPEQGSATLATLSDGKQVLLATAARDKLLAAHPEVFGDEGYFYDGFASFEDLSQMKLVALSPLTLLPSPLLSANFASLSEGSGFVHLAPAFGPDDYVMHETRGVRMDCHVGPNGRLVDLNSGVEMPESLAGKTLDEATLVSCGLLSDKGMLVKKWENKVEANVCWRHKKAVFFKASQQWALDLHKPFPNCPEGLAARAKQAVSKTKFVPDDRAKEPLLLMLSTRRFWTLSRDRYWGLPLPFFRSRDAGLLHPNTEMMWGELVNLVKKDGVEAWQDYPTPEGYVKSTQTADVWFDSGAAWLTASENGLTEADMVVEGRDQTRGWFLSSFLLHAFKNDQPPFKAVMTHSFVVDENGHKFSKSKGGGPDHKAVFDKSGADAFRLWVSAQNVGDECKWSKTSLEQATQDLKDWRSFLRFHLANMKGSYDGQRPLHLRSLDELALEKLDATRTAWMDQMSEGKFNQALVTLSKFRQWASTEWFELSKRTLYCAGDQNHELASVQWVLNKSFLLCAQMLSPFLPFATEEAYLCWPERTKTSLFLHALEAPPTHDAMAAKSALEMMKYRRGLLPLVEKARSLVGKGEPVCLVVDSLMGNMSLRAMRELFPGCYVRVGDASCLEQAEADVHKSSCAAGKPKAMFAAHRCDRCRGYFSEALSCNHLCTQCEAELK